MMFNQAIKIIAAGGLALAFLQPLPGLAAAPIAQPPKHQLLYSCPDLAERSRLSALAPRVDQGYDGWFFRQVDFESGFSMPSMVFDFLTRLTNALDERGAKPVIMTLPPRSIAIPGEVPPDVAKAYNFDPARLRSNFVSFLAQMRETGALVVDTAASLNAPDPNALYFQRDLHWRPEGARLFAEETAKTIKDDPRSANLPTHEFASTQTSDRSPWDSATLMTLQSLCTDPLPKEYRTLFQTNKAEASVDDLLGSEDVGTPVALVGTSFSDERNLFNFAGFIEQYLGMEVASYAISGGGIDQSLYQFLHSDAVADQSPRYVVWEVPFSGRIEDVSENLIRQIVPAARGICDASAAVVSADYQNTFPKKVSLSLPRGDVTGNGYYVAMTLSDPSVRNFVVDLRYDDGRDEIFTVVRPSRVATVDKLFVELSPEFQGKLTNVDVRPLDGSNLSGKMMVCGGKPARNALIED